MLSENNRKDLLGTACRSEQSSLKRRCFTSTLEEEKKEGVQVSQVEQHVKTLG